MVRRIPLINRQALGSGTTIPGAAVQGRPRERRLALGQMGPSIGGEELAYRGAADNLEGIKRAYSKLVTLLGEDRAEEILKEAGAAVEKAQSEYVKQLPQR
jgi:hypothetical protein